MGAVIGVLVGLVIGFIAGWLVRDARSRPLTPPGERFGIGVPAEWHRRQTESASDSRRESAG
jgi:gas vesicle protein